MTPDGLGNVATESPQEGASVSARVEWRSSALAAVAAIAGSLIGSVSAIAATSSQAASQETYSARDRIKASCAAMQVQAQRTSLLRHRVISTSTDRASTIGETAKETLRAQETLRLMASEETVAAGEDLVQEVQRVSGLLYVVLLATDGKSRARILLQDRMQQKAGGDRVLELATVLQTACRKEIL